MGPVASWTAAAGRPRGRAAAGARPQPRRSRDGWLARIAQWSPSVGRILKGGGSPEGGSRQGPPALLAEARAQAEAIVAAARAEAVRIEAAARAEADACREAREAADRCERERLRAEVDEEVVGLALAVAAKVLAVAVEDPRAARESARRALRQVPGRGRCALRCHPADAGGLRSSADELWGPGVPGTLDIRPDPAMGRGGVLVETDAGVVDARIEEQLRALARGLGEPA